MWTEGAYVARVRRMYLEKIFKHEYLYVYVNPRLSLSLVLFTKTVRCCHFIRYWVVELLHSVF